MNSIKLPIIGQGSQPLEQDGVALDYIHLPKHMTTYVMPDIRTDLNEIDLTQAKEIIAKVQIDLDAFPLESKPIDITHLDEFNRKFIDELLGEGEVSVIGIGGQAVHIQESVLAGVWRIQKQHDAQIEQDELEVGIIPQRIIRSCFERAATKIDTHWLELPEGLMNAPPLLTELNAKIAQYRPGDEVHSINLSLLPQTDQDLFFLSERLGRGEITILSRGYGNCRIDSTGTQNVWWVRYFNSDDSLILNTLEVSAIPSVACASPEDIVDSGKRLKEIMQAYL